MEVKEYLKRKQEIQAKQVQIQTSIHEYKQHIFQCKLWYVCLALSWVLLIAGFSIILSHPSFISGVVLGLGAVGLIVCSNANRDNDYSSSINDRSTRCRQNELQLQVQTEMLTDLEIHYDDLTCEDWDQALQVRMQGDSEDVQVST